MLWEMEQMNEIKLRISLLSARQPTGAHTLQWLACMDYQFRGWGSNPVREEHCAPSTPLSEINYNEYTDQTLSVGDKTARKRTGHTST